VWRLLTRFRAKRNYLHVKPHLHVPSPGHDISMDEVVWSQVGRTAVNAIQIGVCVHVQRYEGCGKLEKLEISLIDPQPDKHPEHSLLSLVS
jgi:hypothetical protein